jgi:N-acyl homoserine lactone hydrolase
VSGQSRLDVRLYAFHGGTAVCDKSFLTAGRGIGTDITIPFQYFLIEHPQGRMMFDTGANPMLVEDPASYPSIQAGGRYTVREEDLAPGRLAQIGLKPEQIDLVANSHLHDDHAGGNTFFRHATFLVQFAELQSAWWPEEYNRDNYVRQDFDLPGVHYEELEDDYDVFGDGSVVLIQTPGHSAGTQSAVVRLKETGTVVLASDAAYLTESLDHLLVSTWVWDLRQQVRSLKRLRELRRCEGAWIIPGHELAVWNELRHAPDFYA